MTIYIYNPNSFGGNYNYAHCILNEYQSQEVVCRLILPSNALKDANNSRKLMLISDAPKTQNKLLKKIHFAFRSFFNPFIFFMYLLFKKPAKVVFNDFDQFTAFIWVPFFYALKLRHRFAVILHDPDRDAYFPFAWLSGVSMRFIMSLMDWGIYHEILPKKWYYNNRVQYFSVPHGLYNTLKIEDKALSTQLQKLKKDTKICAILGNVRKEKNYEMAIRALQTTKSMHLLIAGKNASSSYTTNHLKELAKIHNVRDKVTWIDKYLTDAEMNSVLSHTDILLLNYASSFKSQSGILNVAAPFAPYLLVSKTESALYNICGRFNLAEFITPDSYEDLEEKFIEWDKNQVSFRTDWSEYTAYASWKHNIDITLKNFRKL